ncbi:E3 ubiquitin-protein ligase FANCL, partial [Ceratina calcarata]|uniref:E3 ubiquitin-protein ligase FANCL n=1 Tax=Ceratina calcarata TaxID=156304 RepID=A0AAJ7ITV6_9HYME
LDTSSEIQVFSDWTLSTITLSLNDVTLKLRRPKRETCPWTIVHSDLPDVSELGSFDKNIPNLAAARNKLKSQVQILERAWWNLKEIDENCYVLDPLVPKPCHLFRQIYLTSSLSMFIRINALYPMDVPEIKFLGSDIEVELKKDVVSRNLHNWDPGCDFIDNMSMLLNIDTFPKKEEVKKETSMEEHRGAISDEECCICFSLESDDETLPDKICNNNKCRRHFHTSCLLQWLQTIAGNHVVFDHIYGSCPNCRENISCYIK